MHRQSNVDRTSSAISFQPHATLAVPLSPWTAVTTVHFIVRTSSSILVQPHSIKASFLWLELSYVTIPAAGPLLPNVYAPPPPPFALAGRGGVLVATIRVATFASTVNAARTPTIPAPCGCSDCRCTNRHTSQSDSSPCVPVPDDARVCKKPAFVC